MDRHEFTMPDRKQTRRTDVRIHRRPVSNTEWINLRGLPVARPSRIAFDLLADGEDPGAVARITAEAIRQVYDYPGTFAHSLAPLAVQFGLRRRDGYGVLHRLLDLIGDPETPRWLAEAGATMDLDLRGALNVPGLAA